MRKKGETDWIKTLFSEAIGSFHNFLMPHGPRSLKRYLEAALRNFLSVFLRIMKAAIFSPHRRHKLLHFFNKNAS
jgi:hypothetical protein